MKKILFLFTLTVILAAPLRPVAAAKAPQVTTDAYSLIAEVNNLRVSYGLPAYSVNPILMGIAQQHAEFMAANGVSHIGYGGTRPYQRALNAGYPLAGDLSLGGFISENITAGREKSVQDAVLEWQGDDPHWHTMMSTDLMEIGAGVVVVGDYVYYVIDCARPTGANPPAVNTAAPGETAKPAVVIEPGPPLARTAMPSTPNADGRLIHEVKPGETLWLIAVTYKVTVLQIRELNYMSENEAIYPGEKLLIGKDIVVTVAPEITETPSRAAATDAIASALPNNLPTATLIPRSSPTSPLAIAIPTEILPTSVPAAPLGNNPNLLIVAVIFLAALVLAGVLVFSGRGKN